jgi:hypothetical protein
MEHCLRHVALHEMIRCVGPSGSVQPGASVFHIIAHRTATCRSEEWYEPWLSEVMDPVLHA